MSTKTYLVISVFCVFYLKFVNSSDNETIIVNLPNMGSIRGKVIETAWTNRKVYQFIDLRYALAPSGARRFKNPIPVPSWTGTYNAMVEKTGCLSIESLTTKSRHYDIDMDLEDCLTMTITTPNITGNYSVLVYIHGESLYDGSNNEAPPDYFLEKDIVLVTPQYRLGPFGFLSTKSEDIPGNVGVMDVYMALHFIKRFISSFGGDPERITLAGQVGGAAIVHALTLSPIVQPGLFHQVIYHSGSALSPIFIDDNPRDHALDIALRAGCTNMTKLFDLDDCLMRLNPIQLLSAYIEHATETEVNGGNHLTIGGPSPVLPVHPTVLMAAMKNFSYPAMGGVPRNAGTLLLTQIVQGDFDGRIPDDDYNAFTYINHVLKQIVEDNKMIMTSFVQHEFFNQELLENGTFRSLLPSLVDMAGTLLYKLPVLLALNMNEKYLPERTFLYSFDYRGEFNRYEELDEEYNNQSPFKAGVSLTDEALYLFPNPEHAKYLNPTDTFIAKQMVELWTSFVINGQPMASYRGGYWPPMTTLYGPYLKIDETTTVGGNYFKEFTATTSDHESGIKLIREAYYKENGRV